MIPYGKHHIDEDDIATVVKILQSDVVTQGPYISAFEKTVSDYVGVKYAVAVSSGTAALHIAHLALKLTKNDKVITTPNTFVATANAAIFTGAEPHLCDIDYSTLNICSEKLARSVETNKNIKAITPVHFAGLACDMPKIKQIADHTGIFIIEDAAHALGAKYSTGQRVGSCYYSDMTIFSFHPVKMITCGEGGMVTTNNEEIYQRLLLLRNHGITKDSQTFVDENLAITESETNIWYYEMQSLGYNYRITDIQCALAISQFDKLPKFIARRQKLAKQYDHYFSNTHLIESAQVVSENKHHARHIYVIKIAFEQLKISRHHFMMQLREHNISTQVHYIPVHFQPFYQARGHKKGDHPVCENYYQHALTIPLYYDLSEQQQDYVATTIVNLLKENKK